MQDFLSNKKNETVLLILSIFLIALPFCFSFEAPGSSEAREAHVASVILREGNWLLPTRNGLVPSKPLLFHWQTSLLGTFAGLEQIPLWFIRISSLLCSCGIFLCVSKLSKSPYKTILLLASCYGFIGQALSGMVDMCFSFYVWLAITPALINLHNQHPVKSQSRIVFFIGSALAVLAKGPLGLAFPVLLLGTTEASLYGIKNTLRTWLKPNIGWLFFLTIVLPWYIFANRESAGGLVDRQLFFENIARLTGDENIRKEPIWYYLPSLLRFGAPLSLLFFWILVKQRDTLFKIKEFITNRKRDLYTGLLLGAVLLIGILSLAAGKRHTYLLPLYPVFALYCSAFLERTFTKLPRVPNMVWLFVCAASLSTWATSFLFKNIESINSFLQHFSIYAGLSASVAYFTSRFLSKHFSSPNILAFPFLVIFCFSLSSGWKAESKGYHLLAQKITSEIGNNTIAVVRTRYDEIFDPVLYYLHKKVDILPPESSQLPANIWILARYDWYTEQLKKNSEIANRLAFVWEAPENSLHKNVTSKSSFKAILLKPIN